jgi:hypothetical protein
MMYRVSRFLSYASLMLALSLPIGAHEHTHECHECLGHHWYNPGYCGELRWQLMAFAVLSVGYAALRTMLWLKGRTAR